MNKQTVKWHRLSANAAVKQLHTDASYGLSRKEARLRCRKYGLNTLFDPADSSLSELCRILFTDPAILFMIAVALLSCFLENLHGGVSTLLITLCGCAFSARLFWMEARLHKELAYRRIPKARVIRGGHEYLVSARMIAPGDLVVLQEGDIVPVDCRLLSSKELQVFTLYADANHRANWRLTAKNAERVYAPDEIDFEPFFENMLYAGSELLSGEALAISVQGGRNGYLGRFSDFEMPCELLHKKSGSAIGAVSPYLRLYSLALFVLLLPLTVIAILTAPDGVGIMRAFLSCSALLASCSTAVILVFLRSAGCLLRYRAFSSAQGENRAILKTEDAMEQMSELTDLFVLGRCGISDGKPHLYRCFANGRELFIGESATRAQVQGLCECYGILYRFYSQAGEMNDRTEELSEFCRELFTAGNFDVEALTFRLKNATLSLLSAEENQLLIGIENRNERYRLLFTDRISAIKQCNCMVMDDKIVPLTAEQLESMIAFCKSARNDGCMPRCVIRQNESSSVLVGITASHEQVQTTLSSVLEGLRQEGVRTFFFLRDESASELRFVLTSGLFDRILFASQIEDDRLLTTELCEKYRVFLGFSEERIGKLMYALKKNGARVAVLGTKVEELPLMRKASLAISCDHVKYADGRRPRERHVTAADKDRRFGCPAVQRHSHILIGRAGRLGGGLSALLSLTSDCRAALYKLSVALRFLMVSQLSRLLIGTLSASFGIAMLESPFLLYSGWIVESIGVFWLLSLFVPQNRLRKHAAFTKKSVQGILKNKGLLWTALLSSGITLLYTLILHLAKIFTFEIASSFLFCSLVLMQLCALFVTAKKNALIFTVGQAVIPIVSIAVPVCLFVIFSVPFEAFRAVTHLGAWNWISVCSLPLFSLLYLLFSVLFDRTAK